MQVVYDVCLSFKKSLQIIDVYNIIVWDIGSYVVEIPDKKHCD